MLVFRTIEERRRGRNETVQIYRAPDRLCIASGTRVHIGGRDYPENGCNRVDLLSLEEAIWKADAVSSTQVKTSGRREEPFKASGPGAIFVGKEIFQELIPKKL